MATEQKKPCLRTEKAKRHRKGVLRQEKKKKKGALIFGCFVIFH